jgi:hypothetical protein
MKKIILICLAIFVSFLSTISQAEYSSITDQELLKSIWEKFLPPEQKVKTEQTKLQIDPLVLFIGSEDKLRPMLPDKLWPWRDVSFEFYFYTRTELARSVFGLAQISGDVSKEMKLDRFEKGVQGFHYDVDQICVWLNSILNETVSYNTDEEARLIGWLLSSGVINIISGKAVPGKLIHHILGAAPGKKRSLAEALLHERLHVRWDEDLDFKTTFMAKWNKMTKDEKEKVYNSLSSYSRDNELQIIEEWAVKSSEVLAK